MPPTARTSEATSDRCIRGGERRRRAARTHPHQPKGDRMQKLVTGTRAGVFAVALAATVAVAAPASAAETPRNEGASCVQAGLNTLKDLGLLQAAAKKEV